LDNPKVFFRPRAFAFSLISWTFISPPFSKNYKKTALPLLNNIVFLFWLIVKSHSRELWKRKEFVTLNEVKSL
jgi:hypothetical protein